MRLCLLLASMLAFSTALADQRGRRVSDVLDELRAEGLTFIYSSQVLNERQRVESEPRAQRGLELAREILEPHGLALSQAAPHVYAVVAAGHPARRAPASPPLRSPADAIEEVVVQTSRYALSSATLGSQTFLTQGEVKDMPRLADETLRAIARLPGTATNGFSSLGSVRGGEPSEIAIVLDGLRLYEPFHLKNFLSPVSLLDSRLISGMEFLSGGFPAIYGDRMSAIVDAQSVHIDAPRYYELGLNLFHASALAAASFADDRGHALISARRSNIGDLAQYSENKFGEPHYSDGFARVDYEFSDATRASFDLLMSRDRIEALREQGAERASARYRNIYVWGTLDHEWSERMSTRAILSLTDLENVRRATVMEPEWRSGRVRDERYFHVAGLRVENDLLAGEIQHRFGAEVRRLWGRYDYESEVTFAADYPFWGSPPVTTARTSTPKPDGFESAAFWDARTDLGRDWTVQAGLRVDTQTYDGSNDGAQWSPRLNVLHTLDPRTHLRASWGRFYQSQAINELQVEDGIEQFYPAQYADHAILSIDHAFEQGVDLRVEAYRKDYRRINPRFENIFDPLVLFPEAEFDRVRVAPQSARAVGVETLLRVRPHGPWSGWLGYTWARVEDRIDGRDVPRSWDQRHAVTAGLVWAKGPWNVTVASSYHSGWPTAELQLAADGEGNPQLVRDERNRARFAYYNTIDARATRTFILAHGALDVFLELSNALERENPCCVRYERTLEPDGTLTYSRDTDPWLPLVPSFGVLWRY